MSTFTVIGMSDAKSDTVKDTHGNLVVQTAPAVVSMRDRRGRNLLVYECKDGRMIAYLSSRDASASGTVVTSAMSEDDWRGIVAQVIAAKALTGKAPTFEREIDV